MLLDKTCKTCGQTKLLEEFYFSKQKKRHESDCKKCYQKKKSVKREERIKNGAPRYVAKKKKCIDCDNLCDARDRILRCHSCSSKYQYKNHPTKAEALKQGYAKLAKNPEYINMLSSQMKEQRQDPDFIKSLNDSFQNRKEEHLKKFNELRQTKKFLTALCDSLKRSGKFSKLHQKLNKQLKLEEKGFKSEQIVSRYFADELHEHKKIIIEINGDYVHANPNKYKDTDVIRLPTTKYLAMEKWESDRIKKETLESLGYKVFVIWESDDLVQKEKELMELLK